MAISGQGQAKLSLLLSGFSITNYDMDNALIYEYYNHILQKIFYT